MRIQKYLSQQNIVSRRKAEEYLLKGLIKVNGVVITTLGFQIDPDKDKIEIDYQIKQIQQNYIYLAFHKPKGYFTNCPEIGEKEIKDILPKKFAHLSAIGRLDKDSEGLILLSDDGIFAKTILNAEHPHTRRYRVWINHPLSDQAKKQLESGVSILGKFTKPVTIEMIHPNSFIIVMNEGRNRQIRRMLYSVGCTVIGLKRLSFGQVELAGLKSGEFRLLSSAEVDSFSSLKQASHSRQNPRH